jgi:serine/threonine protein kinase
MYQASAPTADGRTDRVAVTLAPSPVRDRGARRRLRADCLAAAVVNAEPGILAVRDLGFTPEHHPFLVSDLPAWGTLAQRLEKAGPLPIPEAAAIGTLLSRALQAAHSHGVLHLGLGTDTVFFTADGRAALGHFGLAWAVRPPSQPDVPAIAVVHAPRELFGWDQPTIASDVYGLGSVLWTALAGRAPFEAEARSGRAALYHRLLSGAPPAMPRPGVPTEFAGLLTRMLDPEAVRRPELADVVAALEGLGRGAAGGGVTVGSAAAGPPPAMGPAVPPMPVGGSPGPGMPMPVPVPPLPAPTLAPSQNPAAMADAPTMPVAMYAPPNSQPSPPANVPTPPNPPSAFAPTTPQPSRAPAQQPGPRSPFTPATPPIAPPPQQQTMSPAPAPFQPPAPTPPAPTPTPDHPPRRYPLEIVLLVTAATIALTAGIIWGVVTAPGGDHSTGGPTAQPSGRVTSGGALSHDDQLLFMPNTVSVTMTGPTEATVTWTTPQKPDAVAGFLVSTSHYGIADGNVPVDKTQFKSVLQGLKPGTRYQIVVASLVSSTGGAVEYAAAPAVVLDVPQQATS